MQLLKPLQSIRERLREALRLHRWIRDWGGLYFRTYASALFIARCCAAMHFCSQRQLRPMFSRTES